MPSGLIPAHYGAPRHYSLPDIGGKKKPQLVVGHCDKMNIIYIRPTMEAPAVKDNYKQQLQQVAFMRYKRITDNMVRLDRMYVPEELRGRGYSTLLAREAMEHLSVQNRSVDVQCPITEEFVRNNQYGEYIRRLHRKLPERQNIRMTPSAAL